MRIEAPKPRRAFGFFFALLFAAAAEPVAAQQAIGIVVSGGEFRLDNAPAADNATVFDGSLLETGEAPSRLRLNSGAAVLLAASTKARVRSDGLELEAGGGEVRGRYPVYARRLRIEPDSPSARLRILLAGDNAVQVAALTGSLRVFDARGVHIANMPAGAALQFEPQSGQMAPPSNFAGCVLKKDGVFVLYDRTTRLLIELRGDFDFASYWGDQIQVAGTTDTAAESKVASQVVDVSAVTPFAKGGCSSVAEAVGAEAPVRPEAPAAPTPQPAPSGGMSAGTKVAIIGAIAGGGAAAAVFATQGGKERSP